MFISTAEGDNFLLAFLRENAILSRVPVATIVTFYPRIQMAAFCTAINCMDGRTQLPVNEYLRRRLGVDHVDTITEPGPVRILAEEPQSEWAKSILRRLDISVGKHKSQCIAVIAHHDCAGNPADEQTQKDQLHGAARFLRDHYPAIRMLMLWVDATWSVSEVVSPRA